MHIFVISFFTIPPISLKKRWLKWQDSNLESFNFESGILSFNQLFYASQIYSNRILNMKKFKTGMRQPYGRLISKNVKVALVAILRGKCVS
jgi:hypothetical protein